MAQSAREQRAAAERLAASRSQYRSELGKDALADYAAARDRLVAVREAWRAAGSPAVTKGSTGQTTCHPLLSELHALEAHVDRLRASAKLAEDHWPPPGELVNLRSA